VRKKFILVLVAMLGALGLTAGLATAASANSANENYQCAKVDYINNTFVWDCTGSWYAGTPGARTFGSHVTETYNESTGWTSTGLQSITSTDGRKKDVHVYCQYHNGSSSGEVGHYIVGGGYANTLTLSGGRFPCDNYHERDPVGIYMSVVASYGSGTWRTDLTFNNESIGGLGHQYAHPWRTCSC
jgi:hypothetical protein